MSKKFALCFAFAMMICVSAVFAKTTDIIAPDEGVKSSGSIAISNSTYGIFNVNVMR